MYWFKHYTDSLDDGFIIDLITNFSGDGYMVYFGLLEIIARESDTLTEPVKISYNALSKKFQLDVAKLKKIFEFIANYKKIIINQNGEFVELLCPKMLELADVYTKRKIRWEKKEEPKQQNIKQPEKKEKNNLMPEINNIVNAWNEFANKHKLATIQKITPTRIRHLKARLQEKEFDINKILYKISNSKFLLGLKNDWQVSFDFIITPSYIKILEGKYDDKKEKEEYIEEESRGTVNEIGTIESIDEIMRKYNS